MQENAKREIRAEGKWVYFDAVKSQILRSTRAVPKPSWNSGRDAPVSTSCLFRINLFGGLILFQMHFFLKYNKSILCSYSGFLM